MVKPRRVTASSRTQKARIDPFAKRSSPIISYRRRTVCLFPDPLSLLPDSATAGPDLCLSVITSLLATKEVSIRVHVLGLPQTCYGVLHVMDIHTHRLYPQCDSGFVFCQTDSLTVTRPHRHRVCCPNGRCWSHHLFVCCQTACL